jgi:hypothetical protein
VTPLPKNFWELLGAIVQNMPAILAAAGVFYTVWQNRGIHKQLNGITQARVDSAGATGHAEGMLAGMLGEREEVAKALAAVIASEVAKKLAEGKEPAIKVKPVGGGE